MDLSTFESIGKYLAYSAIIILFFIKTFSVFSGYLKNIFGKGKGNEKPHGNNISISVDQAAGPQLPHIDPGEYHNMLYLLLQQAKIQKVMHSLKSDILKEQMEYFKKQVKPVKSKYIDTICDLLNEAGIENIHLGTYFINAENFIELCGHRVETAFRQMCRDNHFTEKTQSGFKALIETNITIIDGLLNELIMKRYPQRQLLKDIKRFEPLRHHLRETLTECFVHSRDVATEREEKVGRAREEFENHIYKITGIKYSLDL